MVGTFGILSADRGSLLRCSYPRYVPFNVFSNYEILERKKTISPLSSTLSGVVAVVQVVLGIRQLSLNYGSSINTPGLSSLYLIVILHSHEFDQFNCWDLGKLLATSYSASDG